MSRAPLSTRRGNIALVLVHNCIVHPLAAVCWLVRIPALGDWLHDATKPVAEVRCAFCERPQSGSRAMVQAEGGLAVCDVCLSIATDLIEP